MTDRRAYKSRATDEGWFKAHWREFMAWSYGIICLWDFMIAPIFFAWFSSYTKTTLVAWVPLTTSGGGLYHVAMGAIIGVSSYGKTQESVTNMNTASSLQTLPSLPSSPNSSDDSSDNSSDNSSDSSTPNPPATVTPAPVTPLPPTLVTVVTPPTPPTPTVIPVAPATVITHTIESPETGNTVA